MPAPANETRHVTTRMLFRAWKVSDADAMTGPSTPCTRDKAFGTHVCDAGLLRLEPIYDSYEELGRRYSTAWFA